MLFYRSAFFSLGFSRAPKYDSLYLFEHAIILPSFLRSLIYLGFTFVMSYKDLCDLHLYFVIHWASEKSQGSLLTLMISDILPFNLSHQHHILKKHFQVSCRLVKLHIAVLFTVKWSKTSKEKSTSTAFVYNEWKKVLQWKQQALNRNQVIQ